MPRAIWSGAISFGLVTVPVKLHPAVSSHDVRFTQLHADTGARVRRKRVDEQTGEEVAYGDIVKGYEIADGRYVRVDPEELQALAPEASRTIDVLDFVELSEVDPIRLARAYYLVPDGEAARRPYRLLVEAMERSGRAAVGRFVMRTKEHLALVRPRRGVLVANTMHHADEVVEPEALDIDGLDEVEVGDRELEMAERLIDSLTTEWEPERYRDEHHERVVAFLEDKAAGREVVVSEPEEAGGEVVDLMDALERSLRDASGGAGSDGREAAGRDDELASMSKKELYDLAQAADLPGRSSMTKDELVEALREADVAPATLRRAS
jgi:DNA end-binding protein Ku